MADPGHGGIPHDVDDGDDDPITPEDQDTMDAEWDAYFQELIRTAIAAEGLRYTRSPEVRAVLEAEELRYIRSPEVRAALEAAFQAYLRGALGGND